MKHCRHILLLACLAAYTALTDPFLFFIFVGIHIVYTLRLLGSYFR